MNTAPHISMLDVGRDKLPGEVDWWFEPGNRTEQFAADLIALCGDGGALAERSGLMLLAMQWHMEKGLPLPPELLKALACVLDLVVWRDGKPVPAAALRPCLGLPKARNLEAYLAVARAEPHVTNAQLGKRFGLAPNTVGRWRNESDIHKWSNSKPDVFFPLGLPADIVSEDLARLVDSINSYFDEFETSRLTEGEWRRRKPSALAVEPRLAAFRLALDCTARQVPLPEDAVQATARLLGSISIITGAPVPLAPQILGRLGLPEDIKALSAFLAAARKDGEALALGLRTETYEQLVDAVDKRLASGDWQLVIREVDESAHRTKIRGWRRKLTYRRFARAAALWPGLVAHVWSLPQWKKRQ